MRKTIAKLEQDPSKQQEIDFLSEIAESIPDDAYLKRLFTERFVNFIAQKIRDDWYCDLMDMYQAEINNAADAEASLKALQRDFERYISKTKKEIKGLNVKISELASTAESKSQVINQQDDRYWELRRELDTVNGKAMRDVALLKKEKEGLEAEITNLKAKMFDMQEERI